MTETLQDFATEAVKNCEPELPDHHPGTWKKFSRRLLKMVYEGKGVLHDGQKGNPLKLTAQTTSDPVVVDLAGLAGLPELQRFVVAAIFHQLKIARTGENAVKNLVYPRLRAGIMGKFGWSAPVRYQLHCYRLGKSRGRKMKKYRLL